MSTVAELVRRAQDLGAKLWVEDNRVELDIPADFPDTLIELLRQNKVEVLGYLCNMDKPSAARNKLGKTCDNGQPSIGDELERVLALGARLKRGEITALRCGISGQRCTTCQGVPCLGSESWEEVK